MDEGVEEAAPEGEEKAQLTEEISAKFHFVDFYNTSGERGYPKVEFKLL